MLTSYLKWYLLSAMACCCCWMFPFSGSAQRSHAASDPAGIKRVALYPPVAMHPDTLLPVAVPATKDPDVRVPALRVFMPLRTLRITSTFGWRRHPVTGKADYHKGVDLAARSEPVYCILDGRVSETGYSPILGNYVRIAHGEIQSIYGHLSFIWVTAGQSVSGGHPVGITGATGRATGEHLHFSISTGGTYIHPLYFLNGLLTGIEHKL